MKSRHGTYVVWSELRRRSARSASAPNSPDASFSHFVNTALKKFTPGVKKFMGQDPEAIDDMIRLTADIGRASDILRGSVINKPKQLFFILFHINTRIRVSVRHTGGCAGSRRVRVTRCVSCRTKAAAVVWVELH